MYDILAVGVNRGPGGAPLSYAEKDAEDIGRFFDGDLGPPNARVSVFAGTSASVVALELELLTIATRRPRYFTLYFSGHGNEEGVLASDGLLRYETLIQHVRLIDHLEALGRAPTTINRALRTLAHSADWVHQQPTTPSAATGMPTAGIKELSTDEPDARKLSRRDVLRLFKAADRLLLIETRRNSRPRRNRAMLALLYFTGLRISELTGLMLDQWDGKRLHRVRRKGNVRSTVVYVHREAREYLADYLDHERPRDDDASGFLLLPRGGRGRLNRRTASRALARIADEASKHGDPIHLHPHRLRHTFGHELSRRGTPPTEIAAHLGHQSLKYVGRYARATQAEREAVLDALSTGSLDSAA